MLSHIIIYSFIVAGWSGHAIRGSIMKDTLQLHRDFQNQWFSMFNDKRPVCFDCGGSGEVESEVAVIDHMNGGYLAGSTSVCQRCDGEGFYRGNQNV